MQPKKELKKRTTLQKIVMGSSGTLHALGCPVHGLPAVLVKAGLMPAVFAAPLYAFHESIVDKVTQGIHVVSSIDYQSAHHIAHTAVDYSGWVSLGIFMTTGAYSGYTHFRKKHAKTAAYKMR